MSYMTPCIRKGWSAAVGKVTGLVAEPEDLAVAGQETVFSLKEVTIFQEVLFDGENAFAVFGMDAVDPVGGIGKPLGGEKPSMGLDLRADIMPGSGSNRVRRYR